MRGSWRFCSRLLVLALCHLVVIHPLSAQQGLRIEIVEGSRARNVVERIAARPLTVRVNDADGRPVSGATVTFIAPPQGPSGEFSNGLRTLTVATDSMGFASAGQYHPNSATGRYNIEVRAQFQNQMTSAMIAQENVAQGKGHGKLIAILVIAGAAVAGVVVASLKKGSGTTGTTTPPTITPGTSTVGAPTTP